VWGECSLLVSTVWNSPTSYYIHRILISSENGDDKCRVKNGPQTYLSRISKIRSAPMNEISKSEWCKSLTEQLQDFHTLEPVSESQNCKSYSGGPGTQNFGLLWVTLGHVSKSKSEWCKSLTEWLQDFHTLEPMSESQNCKSYSGGPGTQIWVTDPKN
jgi:hypothetical protein